MLLRKFRLDMDFGALPYPPISAKQKEFEQRQKAFYESIGEEEMLAMVESIGCFTDYLSSADKAGAPVGACTGP